jgi:hypothetical protein
LCSALNKEKRGGRGFSPKFSCIENHFKKTGTVGRKNPRLEGTIFPLFRENFYDSIDDSFVGEWFVEEDIDAKFFQFRPLVFTHETA